MNISENFIKTKNLQYIFKLRNKQFIQFINSLNVSYLYYNIHIIDRLLVFYFILFFFDLLLYDENVDSSFVLMLNL